MLKELYDRLAYAVIGFVLGSVLAVVLWFLYDAGFSRRAYPPEVHAGVANYIKYVGGFFAAIGFLFKASVGSAVGGTVREVHEYEVDRDLEVPRWLVACVLVGVVVALWLVFR